MFPLIIIAAIFIVVIYRYAFRPTIRFFWKIIWGLIRFAIKVLLIGSAIILVMLQVVAPGI